MYRAHQPFTICEEDTRKWRDHKVCGCRQDIGFCERNVKVHPQSQRLNLTAFPYYFYVGEPNTSTYMYVTYMRYIILYNVWLRHFLWQWFIHKVELKKLFRWRPCQWFSQVERMSLYFVNKKKNHHINKNKTKKFQYWRVTMWQLDQYTYIFSTKAADRLNISIIIREVMCMGIFEQNYWRHFRGEIVEVSAWERT